MKNQEIRKSELNQDWKCQESTEQGLPALHCDGEAVTFTK